MSGKVDRWHNAIATGKCSKTQLPIPRVCVTFCHSPEKERHFFDNDINQVIDAIYLEYVLKLFKRFGDIFFWKNNVLK